MYKMIEVTETPKKNDDEEKTKNSKYHTMFIDEIPEKKELIEGTENTYKIVDSHKRYRIFIDSFLECERGLHSMFNTLWNADENDVLELRINSFGGSVKEGQNFFNIVENKFYGRTTTVLDSAAYSMGALLFCVGNKRVVTEQCDFMLHDYATINYGKGGELESHLIHTSKHLRRFFKKVIVAKGFLTEKEFADMLIGKDFWMDVKELCNRGIATHVLYKGKEIRAKKYLKNLNKKELKNVEKKKKNKK